MNQKLKAKWIKKLRSGEFIQGKDCLFRESNNSFCCLGVARTILTDKKGSRNGFDEFLNMSQANELGGITYKVQEGLAEMNDAGVPFEIIAGFINEVL